MNFFIIVNLLTYNTKTCARLCAAVTYKSSLTSGGFRSGVVTVNYKTLFYLS